MPATANGHAAEAREHRPARSPSAEVGAGLRHTRDFGRNPGRLRMLSYVPPALAPGAALVVALHGCGQKAASHAASAGWFSLADRMGFVVLAPEQARANNLGRCFNWFNAADIIRGRGEAASIAQMVHVAIKTYQLDPRRIYITGLSAGGAMAVAVLASYPELFAGGAIVAGMPYGIAHSITAAVGAMRRADARPGSALAALVRRVLPAEPRRWPRLSIWQGAADATVAPGNADALARQWASLMGLHETPDLIEPMGRFTRQVWIAGGRAAIELNLVEGLGHGMALSTTRPCDVGSPAPFMLEAGVSSALEIVRFWGLAMAETPPLAQPETRLSAVGRLAGLGARLSRLVGLAKSPGSR